MRRILAALALHIVALSGTANADDMIGDAKAGEEVARAICAECHFVAEDQPLIPRADAPPFPEIVSDPAVTEISLRVFLRTPHLTMPNLQLSEKETDDIVRFMLALKAQARQ